MQANTGTSSRTGTLTVAGQTATIAQAGAPSTASADVTLAWDRSADSTVVSYKLYYGVASGTYQTSLSCGNNTSYTVTGLGAGTYYFAVTAGDSSGNESGYSNEVSRTITGCAYSISPLSQSSASAGGAGSVAVTASAGCPWTAASGVSWITITSGSGGTGNGTVNYSVDANTISTARIGTMTIAGLTFTVTQLRLLGFPRQRLGQCERRHRYRVGRHIGHVQLERGKQRGLDHYYLGERRRGQWQRELLGPGQHRHEPPHRDTDGGGANGNDHSGGSSVHF